MKACMLIQSRVWIVCVLMMAFGASLRAQQPVDVVVRKAVSGQAAVDVRPRVDAGKKKAVSVQAGSVGTPWMINGIIWDNLRHDGVSVDGVNKLISLKNTLWYEDPLFRPGTFIPAHPLVINSGDVSALDPKKDTLDLAGRLRFVCQPDWGAFEIQDAALPSLVLADEVAACEGDTKVELTYKEVKNSPVKYGLHFPREWAAADVMSKPFAFDGQPLAVKLPVEMPAGDYACQLVVMAAAGCDTVYPFTLSVRRRVTPEAVLTLTGPPTICVGDETSLKVTFTGEGPYVYQLSGDTGERWFSGKDAAGRPLEDTTILVNPSETIEYNLLSLRQAGSCGGEGAISGTVKVTVRPVPTVVMSGETFACEGRMSPLALGFTGESPFTYQVNGLPERVAMKDKDTIWVAASALPYEVIALKAGGCSVTGGGSVMITAIGKPGINEWTAGTISCRVGETLVAQITGAEGEHLVATPVVTSVGSPLRHEGWLLDGKPLVMPYTIQNGDMNRTLTYTATNDCGTTTTADGQVLNVTNSTLIPLRIKTQPRIELVREYDGTLVAQVKEKGKLEAVPALSADFHFEVEASYITAGVGSGKTIIVAYRLADADTLNYAAPARFTLPDGEIQLRTLALSDNAVEDKVYDGTKMARITEGALTGMLDGEKVSFSMTAAYGQTAVGNNLPVTVEAGWLAGTDCGNYRAPVLPEGLIASILKKQLTVGAPALTRDKAWDGTDVAAVRAGDLQGVVTGEVLGVTASARYDQSEPGTGIRIRIDYTLTGTTAVKANYLAPVYEMDSGAIYKAPTIEAITAPGAICAGGTITLTDPVVDDPEGTVLRSWWTLGGVELTTHTLRLNAEDDAGLLQFHIQTADVVAHSNEVAVTVNALPEIRLTGGGSICAPGDEAVVRVEFTSGTAPFEWYLNGESDPRILADGNVALLTVSPAELTTYRVTAATDAKGCIAVNTGNEVTVAPGTKPAAVISGESMICGGGSASVRIDFTGPAPYYYRLTGDISDRVAYLPTTWATVTPEEGGIEAAVHTYRYQVEELTADGCIADVAIDLTGEAQITVNRVQIDDLDPEVLSVVTGEEIIPVKPAVRGNYTSEGWLLNGKPVTMPYVVKATDNGAWMTYGVINTCDERVETDNYMLLNVTDGKPLLSIASPVVDKIKVYDGTDLAVITDDQAATLSGMNAGDVVTATARAVYSNAAVALNKPIVVYYALEGADQGNYSAPQPKELNGGRINPLQLTVSGIKVNNKVYDGEVAATASGGTIVGVVTGEAGKIGLFAQGAFRSKTAGIAKPATVGYTLTGNGIKNYLPPVDSEQTADILKKEIQVIGTEIERSKIYDGTAVAMVRATGMAVGAVPGDVAGFKTTAEYADAQTGMNKEITVHYEAEADGDGLNYNWPADYPLTNGVIIGKPGVEDLTLPAHLCAGGEINLPTPEISTNGGVLADAGHWWLADREIRMPYVVSAADAGKGLSFHVANEAGTGMSDTVTLMVDALPQLALSASGNICRAGDSAVIKLNFTGTAPFDYALSDGTAGRLMAGNETTVKVAPQAMTTYRVTRLSDSRCAAVEPEGAVTVNVGERPSVVISGNALVCAGSEALLRIDFTGEAPYTYLLGGETQTRTSAVSPAYITVRPEATTTYTLLSAAGATCEVAGDDIKGKAVVTVQELPVAVISGDATICNGNPAELTIRFSGGTGEYSYRLTGETEYRYYAGDVAGSDTRVMVNPVESRVFTVDTLASGACGVKGNGSAGVSRPALPLVKGRLEQLADFTLPAGLNVAVPETENVSKACWLLGTDTITMPYTLKDADNGRLLSYVGWNECGDRAESNGVTVKIPASPVKPLAVEGAEIRTIRPYDGTRVAEVLAAGTLKPFPTGDVQLEVTAAFVGTPHAGSKQVEVIYTLTGGDALKYTAPQRVMLTGEITPLQLQVSDPLVEKTKEYDRTTHVNGVTGGVAQNVLPGDEIALAVKADFNMREAGENRKIAVNYTLSGKNSADYRSPDDFMVTGATITPKALTTDAPSLTRTRIYDGSRDAWVMAGGLQGLIAGDEVSLTAGALYNDRHAGVKKIIDVVYALAGTDAANYTAPADDAATDGEISRLQLGVEGTEIALEKGWDGNVVATVSNTGRLTNAVNNDDIGFSVRAEYDSPEVGHDKTIAVNYLLTGADKEDYLMPASYTLTGGVISLCPEISRPADLALCPGSSLEITRPAVDMKEAVQEGDGWWTMNNELVKLPYIVSTTDNGGELKYHIRTSACGVISSEAAVVTVYDLPKAVLAGTQTLCEGSAGATLTLTTLGGQAPYSYRLTGDVDDRYAVQGRNEIRLTPVQTTRYEIMALKDAHGCVATDISGEATVRFIPTPGVTLSGGSTICEGFAARMVLDFIGEAPFTYAVNNGQAVTTYEKRVEWMVAPVVTTDYRLTALSSGGCDVAAADLALLPRVTVTVSRAPQITGTLGDICVNQGDPVNPPVPATVGEVVRRGWTLGSVARNVPWTAADADHGQTLRYWAENSCGRTESNGVPVLVKGSMKVLLAVTGVTVENKVYDGTTAAVVNTARMKIFKKIMNDADCSLTQGAEITDGSVKVAVKARFDHPYVGTNRKVIVEYQLVETPAGVDYVAPADQEKAADIVPMPVMPGAPVLALTRPYDGTVRAVVRAGAIADVIATGDELSVSATAAYRDKRVGIDKPVDVAYVLSGRSVGNYSLNAAVQTVYAADITTIPLMVAGEQVKTDKQYDGLVTAVVTRQGVTTGVIPGDVVSVLTRAAYELPDVGRRKIGVSFESGAGDVDGGNYRLPSGYQMNGVIYAKPEYTRPLEGVADELCAGQWLNPKAPLYQLNEAPLVNAGWTIMRNGVNAPFEVPFKVNLADDGAVLRYTVRNTAGLAEDVDGVNRKILRVNDRPKVAATLAVLPRMEQQTELRLPATTPAITGQATAQGWALVTQGQDIASAEPLVLPYVLSMSDNGKYLVYWAENGCGRAESNRVALNVYKNYPVQLVAEIAYLQTQKRFDGNTTAQVTLGTVKGIEAGHQVKVSAVAAFDTPEAGEDKVITVVFSLTGADMGRYMKPQDVVVNYGLINDKPGIEPLPVPEALCAGMMLDVAEPRMWDNAAPVLKTGWSLGGRTITMPCQVTAADQAKLLTFWAVNSLGITETTPVAVTVHPQPGVVMPADTVINPGGQAIVTYNFTGTAPFHYVLKDGQSGQTAAGQNSFIDLVSPEHAQYYGVNALSDAYCVALPVNITDNMLVQVNEDRLRIRVGDTIFVYDGQPKELDILTEPDRNALLTVHYDGSTARPILPGAYPTVISFPGDWQFGAQEVRVTMIIEKAYAEVMLDNLYHLYDGRTKQATVTTDPEGLNLRVTYNDTTALPLASGHYQVRAEVMENLWQGVADGMLVIAEYKEEPQMINTIEVRGDNNTRFLVKDIERYREVRLKVFDKVGALTYKSDDYANDYDMRDLRAGTYYYVLTYTNEGRKEEKRGAITVIK